jgi:hypothetical protein
MNHIPSSPHLPSSFFIYHGPVIEKAPSFFLAQHKREIHTPHMICIYKSAIGDLADKFLQVVEVQNRRHKFWTLTFSFIGEEAVPAMVDAGLVEIRSDAAAVGIRLQQELQLFSHVNCLPFQDERLLNNVNQANMTLASWNRAKNDLLKDNANMFLQLIKLEDRMKRCKDCFMGLTLFQAWSTEALASQVQKQFSYERFLRQK